MLSGRLEAGGKDRPHAGPLLNPGKRKPTRLAREIWQPLVSEKIAQTLLPLNVPVTSASCGPPYWSVQIRRAATGRNGLVIFSSCVQADAAFGSEPRAGAHLSV